LKPRWAATNIELDAFVLEMIQKALDGAYPEDTWPYQDEFIAGMDRVFSVHFPRLRNWVEKLKNPAQEQGLLLLCGRCHGRCMIKIER